MEEFQIEVDISKLEAMVPETKILLISCYFPPLYSRYSNDVHFPIKMQPSWTNL